MAVAKIQSKTQIKFSNQGAFATSKLIQNLGSNSEQYKFRGNLRDVHGRD